MSEKITRNPLFQQMANEISEAVTVIIEKYSPAIKRRKRSPHLVAYWIKEGAKLATDKTIYKKSIARWRKQNEQNHT